MPDRRKPLPFFFYQRRAQKRTGASRVNLRSIGFFAAAVLLIGLVGWLYLIQASEVAGYAHEIRELQRRKEQLHREIVVLEGQVAEAGSLDRVMQACGELGYSLPDALDARRRLRVGYTLPDVPTSSVSAEEAEEMADEALQAQAEGRFSFTWEYLVTQVKVWLASPPDYVGW